MRRLKRDGNETEKTLSVQSSGNSRRGGSVLVSDTSIPQGLERVQDLNKPKYGFTAYMVKCRTRGQACCIHGRMDRIYLLQDDTVNRETNRREGMHKPGGQA